MYKTAFVTPDRQYEFLRMPFGMVNSGATLVQGLKKVLEGLSGVGSYIDDIVVYNDSWEEHQNLLEQVAIDILVVRSTIFNESVK